MSELRSPTEPINVRQSGVLLDSPLVPDIDAETELRSGTSGLITDEELSECRLILRARATEPIRLNGAPGGLLALECIFHGIPQGARFSEVNLNLVFRDQNSGEAGSLVFVDVEPQLEELPEPVKMTYVIDEGVEFTLLGGKVKAGGNTKREVFEYYRPIRGSGAGTTRARWDLWEDRSAQSGVQHETTLLCTIPATGTVRLGVAVRAKVEKGLLQSIRNLALGPHERMQAFEIEIPEHPDSQ